MVVRLVEISGGIGEIVVFVARDVGWPSGVASAYNVPQGIVCGEVSLRTPIGAMNPGEAYQLISALNGDLFASGHLVKDGRRVRNKFIELDRLRRLLILNTHRYDPISHVRHVQSCETRERL